MATLLAVAALAFPVSVCAGILELELAGMPLVLSEQGYWIALALAALMRPARPARPFLSIAPDTPAAPAAPQRSDA